MSRNKTSQTTPKIERAGRRASRTEIGQRNRAILKFLLMAILGVDTILLVCLVYMLFSHLPYLNLQVVEVDGNRRLSRDEVVEAAGIQKGANLLMLDLDNIAQRLKRHPWIRSASVSRRFPATLLVGIEERSPRAILAADRLYYVDEKAEFFTRLLPGDSMDYPLFTGVKSEELTSQRPLIREMVRKGMGLLKLLEKHGADLNPDKVVEIQIDLIEGLALHFDSGRLVVLGKDHLDRKLQRYGRLKRYLIQRGRWSSARTINLDFEDRALVRSGRPRLQG